MEMPIDDPFDLAASIESHERSFPRSFPAGKNEAAIGHQVRILCCICNMVGYISFILATKFVDCIDWRYPFIDLFVDLQIVEICRRHIVCVAVGGNQYKRGTRTIVSIWLERLKFIEVKNLGD